LKRDEDIKPLLEVEVGTLHVFNRCDQGYGNDGDVKEKIREVMSQFESVLNDKPYKNSTGELALKLEEKKKKEDTVGEILAYNLSHHNLASKKKDLMLRTLISVGFAAIFYFSGKE
jgi:hypothetical protein